MSGSHLEILVKGKPVKVPSTVIGGRTVIATGKYMRTASVMDEELVEGDTVPEPEFLLPRLKDSHLKPDIFTFGQRVPDTVPKYKYHFEWDNAAVIPITSFSDWWEKRAQYDVKKAVKRAKKLGVITRLAEFDDKFVEGICGIYNESPVRQGKPFWHYQKDFEVVKRENSTYLERSAFIGAYYNDQLIGFIKMVYVGTVATTLQVISRREHFNKKPMNALIAKAVEICAEKGASHLVYGSYVYHDPKSSLTEFKRRNGFEQVILPRYYIPLTVKGRIALRLKLQGGLVSRLPRPALTKLRELRAAWYHRRFQSATEAQ